MLETTSGLDIVDIAFGIHEVNGDDRRAEQITFKVPLKTVGADFCKGQVAIAGISNTAAATDMSYQLEDATFTRQDGEAEISVRTHVGDNDGYLDRISYTVMSYNSRG